MVQVALGSDIAIPVWDNLAFDLWMQLIASYADFVEEKTITSNFRSEMLDA